MSGTKVTGWHRKRPRTVQLHVEETLLGANRQDPQLTIDLGQPIPPQVDDSPDTGAPKGDGTWHAPSQATLGSTRVRFSSSHLTNSPSSRRRRPPSHPGPGSPGGPGGWPQGAWAEASRIEERLGTLHSSRSRGRKGRGHVVVGGAGDLDVDEPVGLEQCRQRPAGEDPQVADDLVSGPAVDPTEAHLGEDGLDAEQKQGAVVPGGEIGGGEQEGPPGTRTRLTSARAVSVSTRCSISSLMMTMSTLPDLEGEPRVLHRASDDLQPVAPCLFQGGHRPVEADDGQVDPGLRRDVGGECGPRARPATHVHGAQRPVGAQGAFDEHLGLEPGTARPRDEWSGRILVELL